jgi:ferredoxin
MKEISHGIKKERGKEMRVCVDPVLCSGHGPCVDICPEVFELDEDGIADVIFDNVPEVFYEACREAADNCPTEAISISTEE